MRNPGSSFALVDLAQAAVLAAAALLWPASASGQTVAPLKGTGTPPIELTEAQASLIDAIHRNGLNRAGAPPWHLKFSFQLFDDQGNVKDRGTLEEFWAGVKKYKRIYASANFSQTEVGTEEGIAIAGAQGPTPAGILLLRHDFVLPLPDERQAQLATVVSREIETDGAKLRCFEFRVTWGLATPGTELGYDRYCVDPQTMAMRKRTLAAGRQQEDDFDNAQAFQGRFVPGDLRLALEGKLTARGHLETIEAVPPDSEVDFAPPPGAPLAKWGTQIPGSVTMLGPNTRPGIQGPLGITISPGVAQGLLVKSVPPEYPPVARAARVSGTVVLQAIIGKDGQVTDLKVASGPPLLQQAALDAVQQWVYRPYQLNGSPAQVRTTINVVFQLGGPPAK